LGRTWDLTKPRVCAEWLVDVFRSLEGIRYLANGQAPDAVASCVDASRVQKQRKKDDKGPRCAGRY
jgi:hypothetical protein